MKQPLPFRLPATVLAALAVLALANATPATACDKSSCDTAACPRTRVAAAHPNAAHRAKAKPRRAAPTAKPAPAGVVAVIDAETGMLAPATPEQIGALAQARKSGTITPMSAVPEVQVVRLADGTLMADVPASMLMSAVAHRDASGKVSFTCGEPPVPAAPVAAPALKWEVK